MDQASGSAKASLSQRTEKLSPFVVSLLRAALYVALIIVLCLTGLGLWSTMHDRAGVRATEERLLAWHGLTASIHKRLASQYVDQNGDLLADAPTDASKQIAPDTIVLAHYIDRDADTQIVDWENLRIALANVLGREVVLQEYRNSADDVAAVKAGAIQLVALHAADTPYIVNNAGFIPVAVLGNEAGSHGNRLDIAFTASSKVQTLAELRGHTLTCTAPDSITGYRAALAILSQETGMRPHVDYSLNFSHGQKRSIVGLARGDYEITALSDDKLQSMLQKGDVEPSQYRVIYQSEVIPRLTIGHVYNLAPELANGFSETVLEFSNVERANEESGEAPMRFMASNYVRDFEFVRRIDDSFDPRFSKILQPEVPEAPPADLDQAPTAEEAAVP